MEPRAGLLSLPTEILQHILLILSTPSFVQASICCKTLYELAENSRSVVLYHLQSVPGIKIGLDDPTVATSELFLLFRQRASKHLYGSNFSANCLELRSRNVRIDTDASCITELDRDYVTMCLVMKDSLTIRQYDTACSLSATITSPFCGGKVKVLQTAYCQSTTAVLYQWEPENKHKTPPWFEKAFIKDHPYKKAIDLTNTSPPASDSGESFSDEEDVEPPKEESVKQFHLQLHDTSGPDAPVTFTLAQHEDLVPRHLAIDSRLQWAILWDSEESKIPTDNCKILQYKVSNSRVYPDDFIYEGRIVWPTDFNPRPIAPSTSDIDKGSTTKKPRKIAYFREGRRLSLYAPGDIVPFKVLGVGSPRDSRAPTNSIFFENQTMFQVDTSFFGMHESYWDMDDARRYCHVSHLCLGVGDVSNGWNNCQVLCILRSRSKTDHDDCPHSVGLNRMNHVTAENCKAVARLWGWSETSSTLTGLDVVAVSPHGTRIAIAQWNRVLIWSVDPKMLCEDIIDFDTEDDNKKVNKKGLSQTNSVAEGFYERTRDNLMGWKIANLLPIVIDLDGAVARKMSWTIQYEENDDDESDLESCLEESRTSSQGDDDLSNGHTQTDSLNGTESDPSIVADTMCGTMPEATESPKTLVLDADSTTLPKSDSGQVQEDMTNHSKDDKIYRSIATTDHQEVNNVRALSDRTLSMTNTLRSRPTTLENQVICNPTTATIDIACESIEAPANSTDESLESTETHDISEAVLEAVPSPLDKSTHEPKGKEKEVTNHARDSSRSSVASIDNPQSQSSSKKQHRKKRFTEDELVILTDRGFQIWDFGVWSTGVRKKRWLDEK